MAIRHYNHTHETVAEVRACTDFEQSGGAEPGDLQKRFAASAPRPNRRSATDPMVRYVRSLAANKAMAEDDRAEAERYLAAHDAGERAMSFDWARSFIEGWKNAPVRTDRKQTAPSRVTEDGMYRNPETQEIFKVQFPRADIQRGIRDPQHLYAKALEIVTDAERDADGKVTKPAKVRFNYVSGLVKTVRPEWRMTLAEAKAFGVLYGVCMDCGRVLSREQSINAGVGPTCGADGRWAAAKATVTVG